LSEEYAMKNQNQNKKAEDILTDDSLIENLKNANYKDEHLPKEELLLAQRIQGVVHVNREIIRPDEKDLLERRIINTINKSKQKKTMFRFGYAAGLLLLVGLTVIFQLANNSEIKDFASQIAASDSDFTQLILSGNKKIQIETKESKIEHSETSNEIKINAQKKVEQQTEAKESLAYNTVIVPYGKRTQITLCDNSTVWLNSGSKLVYPVRFSKDKREVYLEGEAIFEVSHNQKYPFHVLTRDLEIKVLGTVFNISAYNDDNTVNTILKSGAVELIYNGDSFLSQTKEKMIPEMLAVYDLAKKTLEQTNVNTKDFFSWKYGYVVVESKTLGYIAKKLSRHYNVPIKIDNLELANESFSGYLDLRNSATQVFEMIAEIVDIEIMQLDDQILITKN